MKTKLSKCEDSHLLQIPGSILDVLDWKDNDILDLKIKDNKLIIENSSENEMNIEDLFEDFNGQYEKEDIDWGKIIGKEVW